jgi:hypothetical protein
MLASEKAIAASTAPFVNWRLIARNAGVKSPGTVPMDNKALFSAIAVLQSWQQGCR